MSDDRDEQDRDEQDRDEQDRDEQDRDEQDGAESFDEDLLGTGGRILSDEVWSDTSPDRPHGLQFADADVTDESVADRLSQEEPDEVPDEWLGDDEELTGDDDRPAWPDEGPTDDESVIDVDDSIRG